MDSDKKKKEKKFKAFDPSKYIETEPMIKEEELEEVLTLAQRRQRGRVMKRFASKIARRRKMTMRKKASNEKLKARALKRARNLIKARLAGQKKYSELQPAQKIQIDKRLQRISPTRIQTLAKKQLPIVRKKEMERISKIRSKNESVDDLFEQFLEENYYAGIDAETKEKRKAHFEKGASMDDDNPEAYKSAPGDIDAETKPSKHTRRYHKMFKKEGTVNCDRRFKIFRKKENEYFSEEFIADAADLMETVDSLFENKKIIQQKSDETGIPYRILKQVFDRGVAAWRTGHRPGTTPTQWGIARINSFATGGKTQKTTDADLWAEYKGKKESNTPEDREEGTDSLVRVYKKNTSGEANEQYFDGKLDSEYGPFEKGDRVSFDSHSMDMGYEEEHEGIVVGSTLTHLRVRDDEGKLYKVRHHDAYFVSSLSEKIELPKVKGLDINRKDMPQIDGKDVVEFLSFIKSKNVKYKKIKIDPAKLKPTQNQFHKAKIEAIMTAIEKGSYKEKPIMVSKDNRVVDGHHTWLAHKNLGKDLLVIEILEPAVKLLSLMHEFPKSYTKKLYEAFDIGLVENEVCPILTPSQLKAFESIVDKLFKKYNVDFNFTKHFRERMSDIRNKPCIELKDLASIIQKIYKRQAKGIKSLAGIEAVLKDLQTDLNIPIAVEYDRSNDEFDVIMKTIMRKKNFKTPNKIITY